MDSGCLYTFFLFLPAYLFLRIFSFFFFLAMYLVFFLVFSFPFPAEMLLSRSSFLSSPVLCIRTVRDPCLLCVCVYAAMYLPAAVSIGLQVELTRTRARGVSRVTTLHFMYLPSSLLYSDFLKICKVSKRAEQQPDYEAGLQG